MTVLDPSEVQEISFLTFINNRDNQVMVAHTVLGRGKHSIEEFKTIPNYTVSQRLALAS